MAKKKRRGKGEGKKFEEDIEKSIEEQGYFKHRIRDVVGYARVVNIGDYISYSYPYILLLELKTHLGKSFPFDVIGEKQLQMMYEEDKNCSGVIGGYIFNLRSIEGNPTYFVRVADVVEFIREAKRKSIPYEWLKENGIRIESTKKITRYTYNIEKLYEEIVRRERQDEW